MKTIQKKMKSQTKSKTLKKQTLAPTVSVPKGLDKATLLQIYHHMVKSRVLEERLIKVYKSGDAYFWIGAPGEEAFGVPLGMHAKVGKGPEYDFFHLHYRGTPTLVAIGMEMIDSIRLIMNRATDPSTGGRNFSNHYCFPQWNVVPVTSPIEVQYTQAIGTAIAQKRRGNAVSIVTGGDAGTAEAEFASCMIWANRPGNELPIYLTVQNNKWGISTSYDTQHGEKRISDRGLAFGMKCRTVNGNDPVEAYRVIAEDMAYIRKTGKPALTEFYVSRLYGHSSASGANKAEELDPLHQYEKFLVDKKHIKTADIAQIAGEYEKEALKALETVRLEAGPEASTVWDHVYAGNENADWRKF